MKKDKIIFMVLLMLVFSAFQFRDMILEVASQPSASYQVVIDVGHGGNDPGKVGINNALEKDVNLAIGTYLAKYLQAAGYSVLMTREEDCSLAAPDASNQKLSDFRARTELIEKAAPMAVVSIHQNSYPSETVMGTQVFYSSNAESKLLASCIQEQCTRFVNPDNHRQIKENKDYYLFRHVMSPIVIVECGFLSNHMEANLLVSEEYQQKMAWGIYMGTVQYLKGWK